MLITDSPYIIRVKFMFNMETYIRLSSALLSKPDLLTSGMHYTPVHPEPYITHCGIPGYNGKCLPPKLNWIVLS